MNLETGSWIAAIIAIPLTLLTWLFKPKEFISFCKNWWGLFFLIFIAGAVIAAWIRGWFNWLTHPVTLSVWVLMLLVFLGMLIAFLIWLFIHSFNKQAVPKTKPNWPPAQEPASQSAKSDWHNFVSDEVFGVLWRWNYSGNTINDYSLVAFCPRQGCMNRLESSFSPDNPNLHTHFHEGPETMTCRRCGFKRHLDCNYETLKRRVIDEIERLVNTGQFVQRLKQSS